MNKLIKQLSQRFEGEPLHVLLKVKRQFEPD